MRVPARANEQGYLQVQMGLKPPNPLEYIESTHFNIYSDLSFIFNSAK